LQTGGLVYCSKYEKKLLFEYIRDITIEMEELN
jgi:hypothetical protein